MVTLFLLARLLFRERNSLNAIGFAALCMLAWDPRAILDASFQMTVLSVVVIAGIVVPVAEHTFSPYLRATRNLELVMLDGTLRPQIAQFRVSLRLIAGHLQPFLGRGAKLVPFAVRLTLELLELMLASCAIELAMSLPMAAYFHRVTALGLPVNVLVVPLIGVALPAALITFVCILISPTLAVAPASVTAGLLHIINGIVQRAGNMRAGDLRIPSPGRSRHLAAILLIAFAVWAARNSRFPVSLSHGGAGLDRGVRSLSPAGLVSSRHTRDHGHRCRPGRLPAAGLSSRANSFDRRRRADGRRRRNRLPQTSTSARMWSRRCCGHAASAALTRSSLLMHTAITWAECRPCCATSAPRSSGWARTPASRHMRRCSMKRIPSASKFALSPPATPSILAARISRFSLRRATTSLDASALERRFSRSSCRLWAYLGSARRRCASAQRRHMLGEDLHADLLKVGHHGSKTSTIPPFLAAVHPKYAIISVGHRNPYGHPRIEVLDHLQEDQVRTFRTDALGATTFYLDGESVTAHPLADK